MTYFKWYDILLAVNQIDAILSEKYSFCKTSFRIFSLFTSQGGLPQAEEGF
ncbi:MAG: hypothetical protein V1698_03010 [bacterium]